MLLPAVPMLLLPCPKPVSPHSRALRLAPEQVPARGGVASPAVAIGRRAVQPAAGTAQHDPPRRPPTSHSSLPTRSYQHYNACTVADGGQSQHASAPAAAPRWPRVQVPFNHLASLNQPFTPRSHPLRSLSLAYSFPFPPAATSTAPRYSPPTLPRTQPPPPATAPRVPINTTTSRRRLPPRRTPRTRCSTAISTRPSPPTRYPTRACTCTPLLMLMAYPILTL